VLRLYARNGQNSTRP